ncbi:MAG: glycerol-3-phosphate 1-O-acyltransferase PlsY [Bacteroidetes bacterium]|jgi:acyl phosphate:glycerol-3-phosphate acyltransferase|nr:glycerol-3-phosphate 1-O-acyltransferase PlsY [Bacteroidota bacterium]MBT6046657.1 glycerol-3-phosphate 1-O-acyltransferase PlsY [Candidatus Scalindua sp.]MBT4400797.1 glycerol-3-phosphate 1-O-acyltransferase PlsY [Bacteroidota bacterium]MBT4410995.1 glycerol-3-phosphate 1-O-acyltransferase PlsY [Bacteroidota bacterium]MBT5426938.1 glycerol-3-phosphate 1-O-acyltransferase PlsY [Bacteroidota bacterium]
MDWLHIILLGIGAYLLGSVPTAIWIGKWFYGIDIREHGSGNAGFSNALRVMGWKAGIPVLLVDVAKGYFAVALAEIITHDATSSISIQIIAIAFGLLAFIGHLYPAFARFKGGKGVATGLGIIIAIYPLGSIVGLGVFVIIVLTFRMMSLSSMTAGLSFPFTVYFSQKLDDPVLFIFSCFIAVMIIYTHNSNIQRIIKGTENKIWFKKPKEK